MPKSQKSKLKSKQADSSLATIQNNDNQAKNTLMIWSIIYSKIRELIFRKKNVKPLEQDILVNNFLKFGEKTVADVMIPRASIIALSSESSAEELCDVMNKLPHTRILIYSENLDNILGFVHIKDMFKLITTKQSFQLSKIIRKPIISTPPMKLLSLFKEMQQKRTHIAIVVDEYGSTSGIITTTDILEEIFGEIDDEHYNLAGDKNYKIINANTIIASGITNIEILEDILKIKLKNPEDEFETIGGLILAASGSVPKKGTKIRLDDGIDLEIMDSSARTLKKIKITLKNTTINI